MMQAIYVTRKQIYESNKRPQMNFEVDHKI